MTKHVTIFFILLFVAPLFLWPIFGLWLFFVYPLIIVLSLVLISSSQDVSIPYIAPILKRQYFKVKFKITKIENILSRTNKFSRVFYLIFLCFDYFYLQFIYLSILLFKSSKESFSVLREEIYTLYEQYKDDSQDEDKNLPLRIIREKIANSEKIDFNIMEELERELFEFHKKNQKKATVFSISGLASVIVATIITSVILNFDFLKSSQFTNTNIK